MAVIIRYVEGVGEIESSVKVRAARWWRGGVGYAWTSYLKLCEYD